MALLSRPLQVHDIKDVEAFVRGTIAKWIRATHARLTPDEFDELTAEGLVIVTQMERRYQPGHGGADPATSRFSGYCAQFLPNKLGAAWHAQQENHRLVTTQRDGQPTRAWVIDQKAGSLDAMLDTNPDGAHITALQTHDDPLDQSLAEDLARALDAQWAIDRALTIQVGVLLGNDETPISAAALLKVRHADVVACMKRIERVVGALTNHQEAA